MKLKPSQSRWLARIAETDTGTLGIHLGRQAADRNALQALLEAKLIKIKTEFEGGLYLTEIAPEGRTALAS